MKRTRAQIKAELMKRFEKEVEGLLDWQEKANQPNLTQFEDAVLASRKKISESMLDTLIAGEMSREPERAPLCPKCGGTTVDKGKRPQIIETRLGTLRMERVYYYCEACQKGFFPLDKQLQVRDAHWSAELARQSVWLSGLVALGDAAQILEEIGQINTSKSSVWRLSQNWGEEYRAKEERDIESEQKMPERDQIVAGEASKLERMRASMDGAMGCVLEEGWKELKLGTIFSIEMAKVLDKETLEEEEIGQARDVSYVTELGGPEQLGKHIWAEAYKRGWTRAVDTQVVDAAAWIWNQAADHFYDSLQLVDWFHATEHLAKAAEWVYPDQESARQRWLNEHKKVLFQCHAEEIARILTQKAGDKTGPAQAGLCQEAGYFEGKKRRMNYLEMRMEGWLIGSGTVESGAKQYKERFTGPGMRWKCSSLQRMIPVRSAVMSGTFDQIWQKIYYSPLN